MSENLRRYTRAIYALDSVAARVPPGAWDNQSCCEDWTARQAAGHAAWLIKNVGNLAADEGPTEEQPEAEVLGDDPAAGMHEIIATTLEQLDRPGSIDRITQTPFGEMSIDDFMGFVWVDPLTHAWDVADAAGIDHGIAPDLAATALEGLRPIADNLRQPGLFDNAVEPTSDDPVSQLVAFTGRTPVNG